MRLRRLLAATLGVLALAAAVPALAGTSSSGGGLLLRDSLNPWFLQNTDVIRYCIAIDPQHFHLDAAHVDEQIRAAFGYWQDEFRHADFEVLDSIGAKVVVGTQNLVKVDCEASPDLKFQLGALTKAQEPLVPDLDSTIALTVREGYDRVNLRGHGFIYVSGDDGPGAKPDPSTHLQRWVQGDGYYLYLVLVHELGHIYGLPDSGLSGLAPMSYAFAQTAMVIASIPENLEFFQNFALAETVRVRHFSRADIFRFTGSAADLARAKALGLSNAAGRVYCVQTHFEETRLEIRAVPLATSCLPLDRDVPVIGRAEVKLQRNRGDSVFTNGGSTVVGIWLPREQKVFPFKDPGTNDAIGDYETMLFTQPLDAVGVYTVLGTGQQVPVVFALQPGYDDVPFYSTLKITAVVDGALVPNLLIPTAQSQGLKALRLKLKR